MWKCTKCNTVCEGKFCSSCGSAAVYMQDMPAGNSLATQEIQKLSGSVKALKVLCIILTVVVAILLLLFVIGYHSAWTNIVDLWENAEELWESSENLWDYNGGYGYYYDYY